MRRFVPLLLASLHLAAARSRSFSIHDDLLAFPQFEVVFAESRISDKEAQALVEHDSRHPTYSADFSQATTADDDSTRTAGDEGEAAEGPAESADADEITGYTYEFLNMSPHRYLCSIPVVQPPGPFNETENALAKAQEDQEHRRAAIKGWELINNFENNCLYYMSGWWSYSFCKNREIVQYHAVSVAANGQVPKRDPNGQEYILGQVPTLPATSLDRHATKEHDGSNPDPARPPAELQIRGDQPYLVQRLEGGTICDLTGKERTIEVQYQCVLGLQNDRISWVKEVVTCSYVMMVDTPRLCKDVAFQPAVERSANPISCRLIVSDAGAEPPHALLGQHASSEQQGQGQGQGQGQAEGVEERTEEETGAEAEADKDKDKDKDGKRKKQEEAAPVTVGGVVVGGKRVLSSGDEDGKPVRLQQLADLFAPQPKMLEIVAQAASKAEGGKIKELTPEELKSLNIDPKAVEEMREKLKKLAGDAGWKVEIFQMNEEDEKELLGYIDEPAAGGRDAGKGTSDGESMEGEDGGEEGKGGRDAGAGAGQDGKDAEGGRTERGEGSDEAFHHRRAEL